ncbi:MAN2A2 [Cordylochernes scorpioides]|uniref:Alpha-mannosidase n=1 Tax=Cordylochernes scorpioides TaxID=51811 RepID=A0ABY6KXN4_9ARAC|nr:MAN2A2 [Cordylochernes scorpioides]
MEEVEEKRTTDPSWLKTFAKYYQDQTAHILDNLVVKLTQDSRRKFIWAEVSYLAEWWNRQSAGRREQLRQLVAGGQLELVTGGWVMADEALTHYSALVEQLALGHRWLHQNLGVTVKTGWAIDPFGLSPTMAYLLRRAGLEAMVVQRAHYAVKKYLAQHRSLEFLWTQTWDHNSSTPILCHLMPFYSYDVPHTCGPDPKVCCQFDFKRLPGGKVKCPWRVPPVPISQKNVRESFTAPMCFWCPLGDDFRFDKPLEWDQQFSNYQRLFDHMNGDDSLHVEAQFGTLADYFNALQEELQRNQEEERSSISNIQPPSLSGDFFTYADRDDHYWSGFYTSRPFYKGMGRLLEAHLRGAEIVYSLALAEGWPNVGITELLAGYIHEGRKTLSLFQHHDAITGTSKDHVVQDYASSLTRSFQNLRKVICHSALKLLLESPDDTINASLPVLEMEEVVNNSLPEKLVLHLDPTLKRRTVVIYNSLAFPRHELITLYVSTPQVEVLDGRGAALPAQVAPAFQGVSLVSGVYQLTFRAEMPALSLAVFTLQEGTTTPKSSVQLFNHNIDISPAYKGFSIVSQDAPDDFTIRNPYLTAMFSGADGMLRNAFVIKTGSTTQWQAELSPKEIAASDMRNRHHVQQLLTWSTDILYPWIRSPYRRVRSHEDGVTTNVRINFLKYGTRVKGKDKSGAYLFLPNQDAQSVEYSRPHIRVTEGPLVSEVVVFLPHVEHHVVLKNSPGVDGLGLEIINVVDILHEVNQELIMRLYSSLYTSVWYTDLNGFQVPSHSYLGGCVQMSLREQHPKLPLQGNVYPAATMAYLQDNGTRLSLLTRHPLGAGSHKPGWLEVFLDRRLNQDDNRGLQQGVTDNRVTASHLVLMLEHTTKVVLDLNCLLQSGHLPTITFQNRYKIPSAGAESKPSLSAHHARLALLHPMFAMAVLPGVEPRLPPRRLRSLVAPPVPLPCDLHLLNLRTDHPAPSASLLLHRLGYDCTFKPLALSPNCTFYPHQVSVHHS